MGMLEKGRAPKERETQDFYERCIRVMLFLSCGADAGYFVDVGA